MFPEAIIIGVEPAEQNVAILLQNSLPAPSTVVIGALSSSQGRARVVDPTQQHWAYRTQPAEPDHPGAVQCITINGLFKASAQAVPFIVKLDIEGAESDVFSANTEWVSRTPVIITELHDWLIPGSGDTYRACIAPLDRDEFKLGENVVSVSRIAC
jgi:FkbM family methyltransferase